MQVDWDAVARFLDDAAKKAQDEANAHGVGGSKTTSANRTETALIFRTLAAAIRFGQR
jgi:hypothetical protein